MEKRPRRKKGPATHAALARWQGFQETPAAELSEAGTEAKRLKDTAQTLRDMGRYLEAMALVQEGIRLFPDYTDLYFLYGTLHVDRGMLREAEEAFQACLAQGEASRQYTTIQGVGTYLAHYNLGMIYEMTGTAERAATHYCEAARAGYTPAEIRARLLGKTCRL